jgi:hypothetical protein
MAPRAAESWLIGQRALTGSVSVTFAAVAGARGQRTWPRHVRLPVHARRCGRHNQRACKAHRQAAGHSGEAAAHYLSPYHDAHAPRLSTLPSQCVGGGRGTDNSCRFEYRANRAALSLSDRCEAALCTGFHSSSVLLLSGNGICALVVDWSLLVMLGRICAHCFATELESGLRGHPSLCKSKLTSQLRVPHCRRLLPLAKLVEHAAWTTTSIRSMGTALSASSPKRRFESARPRVLLLDRRGGFCETSESERPLHPADSDARRAPGIRQGGPIRLEAGQARRSPLRKPQRQGTSGGGSSPRPSPRGPGS